ncbi:hypothetical protein [Microcoleus sp. FACHB-672]|nr:hypothetical protein [Microcoleus sp. FACHB-672]MBD2041853.1 hypothetical protein [Microcoleus sp. FACHB-672]
MLATGIFCAGKPDNQANQEAVSRLGNASGLYSSGQQVQEDACNLPS